MKQWYALYVLLCSFGLKPIHVNKKGSKGPRDGSVTRWDLSGSGKGLSPVLYLFSKFHHSAIKDLVSFFANLPTFSQMAEDSSWNIMGCRCDYFLFLCKCQALELLAWWLPTLSSLVAPEVVITTTAGATSDDKLALWQLSDFSKCRWPWKLASSLTTTTTFVHARCTMNSGYLCTWIPCTVVYKARSRFSP